MATAVAGICLLGAYASTNDVFTVVITVTFGILGYILRKVHIRPAPIVLALVLGIMMESNLRRAMLMSGDKPTFFFTQPISAVLLVMAFLVLFLPMIQSRLARKS